jgi:pyruvate,water dikinase
VKELVAMSGGRYQDLLPRYEAIEREIEREVLKGHAIEYGPLVVWPEDGDANRPPVVGPKSARLADILRTKAHQVPPFFVVSVYGYRAFVEATGLQDLTQRILWSSDLTDPRILRAACESIRAAVLRAAVPPSLAGALWGAALKLRQREPSYTGFAVRSSAVVEDTSVSFAGQFDSVLNVREEGLLEAYKQVVASKYRPETVQYALASGFLDQEMEMPVLVMAMVDADTSGVAYSREPENPDQALITAVRGLAQPIVEGRVTPDRFLVSRTDFRARVEVLQGARASATQCHPAGGVVDVPLDSPASGEAALTEGEARMVAQTSWALERQFGTPQDVEWVIHRSGSLFIVQSRSVSRTPDDNRPGPDRRSLHGYRILLRGALPASRGAASGRVHHRLDLSSDEEVPPGVVLVVPYAPPKLAGFVRKVAAIVSVGGSPTGHMATVAREVGIPCLVGAENAFTTLVPGTLVTVDGWEGTVYEGEVRELLPPPPTRVILGGGENPGGEMLGRLLARVAPLTLTDPDGSEFQPRNCQTLHDIARFVHQRSMAEMFEVEHLSRQERSQARSLAWRIPMPILVVDLGGGLADAGTRTVSPDKILSVPLLALVEGMTDPRLRWAGPVGFDLKGFMSVVVRSTADDQRYGEASYAVCARDFVHFSSRLAYHFATVEAICGESLNENYTRFLFFGGAAAAERREWRAHFLATVLRHNGFRVKQVGDRVEAILAKHRAPVIEEALVMLGRLMIASRQLDMLMQSHAAADVFAESFLVGDYGFQFVRQEARRETA